MSGLSCLEQCGWPPAHETYLQIIQGMGNLMSHVMHKVSMGDAYTVHARHESDRQ